MKRWVGRLTMTAPSLVALAFAFAAQAQTDASQSCSGSSTSAAGHAVVETTVKGGVPILTTAEFTPRFGARLTPGPNMKLPEAMKPDGEPNTGAFPVAKLGYQYFMADGHRSLPQYRLELEAPVHIGGEGKSVYFHVKIGAWEGGKLVAKRNISGIVGLPDVPIYAVGWQLKTAAPRDAEPEAAALDAALKQADHAEVDIHEGSATGPLVASGQIALTAHNDRLATVVSALNEMGAKFNAHTCGG